MELVTRNFFFLLTVYWLTYALKESYIATPIRFLLQKSKFLTRGLECWFCSSTQCSIVASILYWVSGSRDLNLHSAIDFIFHALGGSAFVFILNKKVEIMDSMIPTVISNEELDRIKKEAERLATGPTGPTGATGPQPSLSTSTPLSVSAGLGSAGTGTSALRLSAVGDELK